jgi:DNA-binding response OmpR family regulator
MAEGPRILIVEDHPDIGQLYQRLMPGCQVTHVTDGVQACRALASGSFDLIILDMHLGAMSGLEVLRFARRTEHQTTPIIVISADDSLRHEARDLGADFWIAKPIDIDQFHKVLRDALEDWHAQNLLATIG